MAKKHQNTKTHQITCEKLKKAVDFSPFRRFYRVSNHQQNHPAPTPPPSNNLIKANVPQPSSEQLIPIETAAHSSVGQLIKPKVDRAQAMFIAKQKRTHERNNGGVQVYNERISEYNNRVRPDMRTSSDLGIEIPTKKISRRDSINDRVANFLHRTKIKIRTTTNVGHDMHGNGKDY